MIADAGPIVIVVPVLYSGASKIPKPWSEKLSWMLEYYSLIIKINFKCIILITLYVLK